jgi:hypothetical protein
MSCLVLECTDMGLLLAGWQIMLPATQQCHNLMIAVTFFQTVQAMIVLCVLYTGNLTTLKYAHLTCIALDILEGLLFGIASTLCGNNGSFTMESIILYVSFVAVSAGEAFDLNYFRDTIKRLPPTNGYTPPPVPFFNSL